MCEELHCFKWKTPERAFDEAFAPAKPLKLLETF
jgi:hypothetical protein